MATGNVNFDALLTTTLNNHRPQMEDTISREVGFWNWLSRNDRVKSKSGGVKCVVPLLYGKNSTSKTYDMYETLDITPQAGITAAEYPWKQHAVTVAIAGLEEAMNNGEQEVIDLLQAKVQQAEITAADDFATIFAGDGTGNSGKNFLGIKALIGDASSSITVVGNIDAADSGNTWWRSYVNRTSEQLKLGAMETAYNKASRGTKKPNGAFSGITLYEKHVSLLQPQQRFSDPKTGEAGFENILFHGAAHVADEQLETQEATSLYFLNSEFITLFKLGNKWLSNTPFKQPVNVDARYSQIISYGQLVASNRKLAGSKLEGKTA